MYIKTDIFYIAIQNILCMWKTEKWKQVIANEQYYSLCEFSHLFKTFKISFISKKRNVIEEKYFHWYKMNIFKSIQFNGIINRKTHQFNRFGKKILSNLNESTFECPPKCLVCFICQLKLELIWIVFCSEIEAKFSL